MPCPSPSLAVIGSSWAISKYKFVYNVQHVTWSSLCLKMTTILWSTVLLYLLVYLVPGTQFGFLIDISWSIQEVEKAWKMVDSAYDKEQKAEETILALKEEIVNMTKLVEQGSGLTLDQDSK